MFLRIFYKANYKNWDRIPTENFLVEVNNLLANNSLDEISAGQIQQLADKYKLKDASKKFKNELNNRYTHGYKI